MLLVTGASGFLGSSIARFALERGIEVRAMLRSESSLDLLDGFPSRNIVFADMTDAASLVEAVEDCSAVVHCAATTSESAPDLERSRSVNVRGTAGLLEACAIAGVRRIINISSQSAHPDNPSVYGRTKLEQDGEVQARNDLDWTILRPSIIYGARAKGIFDKMVGLCRKLPVIPVIGPRQEMRPIHADDVAQAVLTCIDTPATIGKVYDLGGADVLRFYDFIGEILSALGKKSPRVPLPIPVAMALARMLSAVLSNPPLTPDNVTGIATVRHVDISAAQHDFGFSPRSFRQGLQEIYGSKG